MRILWMYIGPYNSCNHRDVKTNEERQAHKFAHVDEFWEEVGILGRTKLLTRYRRNIEEIEDTIKKLD